MSNARKGKLSDRDSTNSPAVKYANNLYSTVVLMCKDWRTVDEAKARLIIEYVKDALKAFGDTNQEKKVELKEIFHRAESIASPDSIDSLKKRLERLFLKGIYPKNKKLRDIFFIAIGLGWLLAFSIPLIIYLRSSTSSSPINISNTSQPLVRQEPVAVNTSPNQESSNTASQKDVSSEDESRVIVGKATVSLDLTSSWVELDRYQRAHERTSRGILRGVFTDVRKISKDATFTHRVGTTSTFRPEWRAISPHKITYEDETERKCNPKAKYAYLLYFDISKEKVNVPFDLRYEIDFWNAHNGETEDWQSFFVSRPTNQLIMKVSFPKNKPYTRLHFKHAYGIDCGIADFKDFPNPILDETTDKETGAKVMTWTINSPQALWIYMIGWDW